MVADGAFRARKELVPGAAAGAIALHQERETFRNRDQLPDRLAANNLGHVCAEAGGEPLLSGLGGIGQTHDGGPERIAVGGVAEGLLGGLRQQRGPLVQHQLDVDAGFHLDLGVVVPGAIAVVPGLDDERPVTRGVGREHAFPQVRALAAVPGRGLEAHTLALLALRVQQDGTDAQLVMAFTEGLCTDHDSFAGERLGGKLPPFDSRLNVRDRETTKSKAIRDRSFGRLLGWGIGSRVSRHRLDISEKSKPLLSLRS